MKKQKQKSDNIRRREHYASKNVNDKLIINLRDLSHIMRLLYEGRGSRKHVLIVLNDSGRITQRELTQKLGIQPGSVSEILSKMESAELIARTPNGADRRTTDISLTDKGKMLAAEAAEKRRQRHAAMFSCLTEEEKKVLLSLMEKVYADWEQRYLEKGED